MHTSSILKELEKVRTNVRKEAHESLLNNSFKFNASHDYIFNSNYALIKGFSGNKNDNHKLIDNLEDSFLFDNTNNMTNLEMKIENRFLTNNISQRTRNKLPTNKDDNSNLSDNELYLLLSSSSDEDHIYNYKKFDSHFTNEIDKSIKSNSCNQSNSPIKERCPIKESCLNKKSLIEFDQKETNASILNTKNCVNIVDVLRTSNISKNPTIDTTPCSNQIYEDGYMMTPKEFVQDTSSGDEEHSDSDFVEVPLNQNDNIDKKEDFKDELQINLNDVSKANIEAPYNIYHNLIDKNLNIESVNNELIELEKMQSYQNRMAWTITDQIVEEVKELLELFGVPYISSPTESEAQCAFLEYSGQCDGTITEDSDIWAFGGLTVYKNFFSSKKHCYVYKWTNIINQLGLNKEHIIGLAMLCGCDYSTGIAGIGPVTALEILAYFNENNLLNNLTELRDKWLSVQNSMEIQCPEHIKKILKKICIPDGFPNHAVYNAFVQPNVDESRKKFEWNRPNLDGLRRFAEKYLGWKKSRVDEIILPVMKKYNIYSEKTENQSTLNLPANFIGSKRMNSAITRIRSQVSNKPEIKRSKRKKTNKDGGFLSIPIENPLLSEDSSSDEISDKQLALIPL